jgi:hypothetical protein
MARTCGKAGCHCQQGEKHTSLYLSVRLNNRRRMIYVPPTMESSVRGWVENAQEVDRLLDFISQQCLSDFLNEKEEKLGRPKSAGAHPEKPRRKPP